MRFTRVKVNFGSAPPAWIAVARPYSFVITEHKPGTYAASVNDATKPVVNSTKLGKDFTTFEAAQLACRQFLQRRQ